MTARGVDFLENWIAKNVSIDTTPAEAEALAHRCLTEAAALGITGVEMEGEWGSVEQAIRDAIVHLKEPGTPGD
jgi:hypothetical protein